MVRACVCMFVRMPPCVHVCAGSEWCVLACVCLCIPAYTCVQDLNGACLRVYVSASLHLRECRI